MADMIPCRHGVYRSYDVCWTCDHTQPASRWESFLASWMAVFGKDFDGWLKKRRLFIGEGLRVYRSPNPTTGVEHGVDTPMRGKTNV